MRDINSAEYSRNYGFWNEDEQKAIMSARVAIAGVGGDGYQLGLKLAMMGVEIFDIADPEVFEPENSNRVPGATTLNYGRSKAEVFEESVKAINPDADIRIFKDGVNDDNIEDFTSRASIIFDESELTYLHVGTSLARAARQLGIPDVLVMNIGFSAQVTSFKPDSKMTFEKFMGIPEGATTKDIKEMTVDFSRCLTYLPHYSDLRTLSAVKEGASLPSIAQGVDVASAVGSSQAFLHFTHNLGNNRPSPVWAPNVAYMDAYTLKGGATKYPRLSHFRHLGVAAFNNITGRNAKASYTSSDRSNRDKSIS